MSEKIGPMTLGKRNEQVFLGKEIAHQKDYSESMALTIDEEVKSILDSCKENAEKLLKDNYDKLTQLATNLIERETLRLEDITMIMKGEPLPPLEINNDANENETENSAS
jgi:cell division protease FtsH